jgi:carbon-monoxide dehydrogenase medium subunit
MKPFDHYTPGTLSEALELLQDLDGRGQVIAGGTDLMLKLKAKTISPNALVNIKRLPELKGIAFDEDDGLVIGSLTTLRELNHSPVVKERYPSLAEAAGLMASEQIRSFATVGGNLCNAAPSADLAPPLIAMGGEACIVGASDERVIPLERFFLGPGSTDLKSGDLLKQINLPSPVGSTVFIKHSPRVLMDISVVCLAIKLLVVDRLCKQVKIVLGAVSSAPMRARRAEEALLGHSLTSDRISLVARTASEECSPIDDVRGSAWYRQRMVEVLTRRGLKMFSSDSR